MHGVAWTNPDTYVLCTQTLQHPSLKAPKYASMLRYLGTHVEEDLLRMIHRRNCAAACWLEHITESCMQALQTLALGYLPSGPNDQYMQQRTSLIEADMPLPEAMSRLSALSALTLHNVGWKYPPEGLPHLPNVGTTPHKA